MQAKKEELDDFSSAEDGDLQQALEQSFCQPFASAASSGETPGSRPAAPSRPVPPVPSRPVVLGSATIVQSTLSGQASLGEFKLMADSDDVELGNVINSRREDTTLEAIFEEL